MSHSGSLYIVEEIGSNQRTIAQIFNVEDDDEQIRLFNDLDSYWTLRQLLDYYRVIIKLDLNSF